MFWLGTGVPSRSRSTPLKCTAVGSVTVTEASVRTETPLALVAINGLPGGGVAMTCTVEDGKRIRRATPAASVTARELAFPLAGPPGKRSKLVVLAIASTTTLGTGLP